MRVRGNTKNLWNTIDPVYGCHGAKTNEGRGKPWRCYAVFTAKKLKVDFSVPVPQTLDEAVLLRDLRKVKVGWVRQRVIGDPCHAFDKTVRVSGLVHRVEKVPVVITRLWERPSRTELTELVECGTNLQISICALDSDAFLRPRVDVCKDFLRLGGTVTWRVVSFYFDDTTDEGNMLWDRQDHLMSGEFGAVSDRKALVLEIPARVMKSKKQMNPNWKYLPEWGYWKAPTTKDHKYSPHNHNWTAGVLYPKKDACWVGCASCTVQCLSGNMNAPTEQSHLDD